MHFTCSRGTFLQLSVQPQDFPSTFVHSRELPLAFRAIVGPSMTFSQLSEQSRAFLPTCVSFAWVRRTFHQLPSNFCGSAGFSVNIFCTRGNFCQLPSTFRAPAGAFVNNLHGRRTFHQHQSTFCASTGLNVNLRQLFVSPADLLPTFRISGWPSVNIPCVRRTCQLRSTSLNYSVVQAVQQRFLSRTHEIYSYDPCYFHYSVVPAVRLSWTFLKYRKTLLLSLFPYLLCSSSSSVSFNHLKRLRNYPMSLFL